MNKLSKLVLDNDGNNVYLNNSNPTDYQNWIIQSNSASTYTLTPTNDRNRRLTDPATNPTVNKVIVAPQSGTSNQNWSIDQPSSTDLYYHIINCSSSLYLDNNAQTTPMKYDDSQKWYILPW